MPGVSIAACGIMCTTEEPVEIVLLDPDAYSANFAILPQCLENDLASCDFGRRLSETAQVVHLLAFIYGIETTEPRVIVSDTQLAWNTAFVAR